MSDEADLYLPAQRKLATKEPMEDLLKRARSAGLGILVASQNPGDFDYKLRENIDTWLVGRIQEKNSLAKMQPMLTDCRADIVAKLSGQKPGDFYLLQAAQPIPIHAQRSLMETIQLPETEILQLTKQVKE